MNGVVYVLINDHLRGPFVKVGMTTGSAIDRAKSLGTGIPGELRVVAEFIIPRGLALRDAERAAHDALRRWHHSGEWFQVEPKTAVRVLTRALGAKGRRRRRWLRNLGNLVIWCLTLWLIWQVTGAL